jgi:hypothetical protein
LPTSIIMLPFIYIFLIAVYATMLFLLGEVTNNDRNYIKNLIPKWTVLEKWQ